MIIVYKPIGLTPLEVIKKVKEQKPELNEQTVSFAGRLDPMAEGLLLLLVGDENKQRSDYEALPKTYEFEVLFGVETDTYDLLGQITHSSKNIMIKDRGLRTKITKLLPSYLGTQKQPYPAYSSKTVDGKPLYWWARAGKLGEIIIPEREITITSLSLLSESSLSPTVLSESITDRIQKVSGDFRQVDILATWSEYFSGTPLPEFPLIKFSMSCTSGTYVRSLAHRLGGIVGTGAIAYSIKRTAVGSYTLKDTLHIEPIT